MTVPPLLDALPLACEVPPEPPVMEAPCEESASPPKSLHAVPTAINAQQAAGRKVNADGS